MHIVLIGAIHLALLILSIMHYDEIKLELERNRTWPSDMHQDMRHLQIRWFVIYLALLWAFYCVLMYFVYRMYLESVGTVFFIENKTFGIMMVFPALFLSFALDGAITPLFQKLNLKDEYWEYCVVFDTSAYITPEEERRGGRRYTIVDYIPGETLEQTRKRQIQSTKGAMIGSVVGMIIALLFVGLSFMEHQYFDEKGFHYGEWGKEETLYTEDDFAAIYRVDYRILKDGDINHDDYYAFRMKDGRNIEFGPGETSEEQIAYVCDFADLPVLPIRCITD